MTAGLDTAGMTWRSKNPFPGLRPFLAGETHLFFGRDEPTDALIGQLGGSSFLAVVGVSGSGKSSLVKCGVLPALHGGFLADAGSSWRVAIFRPGNDPIGNLAAALADDEVLGFNASGGDADMGATILETVLRRGSLGLADAVRQARLGPRENLLVVADQFEELFRFKQNMRVERPDDEAAAFVKLLVEAARTELPIYVMITMRSDFLGDCAQFRDLPEVINEGLYLIPRMTRDQLREAIEGPVAMAGAEIAPRLVQRLLNDVGDNPDQLPILQHALMRTWNHWAFESRHPEPIDLSDYDDVGGMDGALDQHLDEVLDGVTKVHPARPERREVAKRMFQTLTEKEEDNRAIRRPATVDEICAVAGAEFADVGTIIEEFRAQGRTFLMPPYEVDLTGETLIDISHESLIRNWTNLREWVEEESRSARIYKRLSGTAALEAKGEAALFGGPDLHIAREWLEQTRPTETWAKRYDDRFALASSFLKRSTERARLNRLGRGVAVLAVVGASLGAAYYFQQEAAAAAKVVQLQTMELARDLLATDPLETALVLAEFAGAEDPRPPRGFEIAFETATTPLPSAVPLGHEEAIVHVDFDSSGARALTVSTDGTARLWDAATGAELDVLGRADGVAAATFVDGSRVVAYLRNGWLRTWDGAWTDSIEVSTDPSNMRLFSRDGSRFALVYDDAIRVWDTGTAGPALELQHPSVEGVVISPDGSSLASWAGGSIRTWDLGEDPSSDPASFLGLSAGEARVMAVTFSGAGGLLAAGTEEGSVFLWERAGQATGRPGSWGGVRAVASFHDDAIMDLGFDRSGRLLVASADGSASIWPLQSGEGEPPTLNLADTTATIRLSGHEGRVRHASFSPDGDLVATASDQDHTVRVWNGETGEPGPVLRGHQGNVLARFSSDGSRVLTAGARGGVRVWSTGGTGWFHELAHENEVRGVAVDPEGRVIATASWDGHVRLWDASTGALLDSVGHNTPLEHVSFGRGGRLATAWENAALVQRVEWTDMGLQAVSRVEHEGRIRSVAFSPDGSRILTASDDQTARIWDSDSGEPIGAPLAHEWEVLAAVFGPDGSRVATGDDDFWARIWTTDGELELELEHDDSVFDLAFSPGGERIVTASGDSAMIWPADSLSSADVTLRVGSRTRAVAFASDSVVITGSDDGVVRVWSATSGQVLYSLGRHGAPVNRVAMSADGSAVTSASSDGSARVWPLTMGRLASRLREVVRGCLTAGQRGRLLGDAPEQAEDRERECRERLSVGTVTLPDSVEEFPQ